MRTRDSYGRPIAIAATVMAFLLLLAAAGCGGDATTSAPATGTQKQATNTGQGASAAGTASASASASAAGTPGGRTVYIDQFVCPFTAEGQALTPGMITAFLLIRYVNNSDAPITVGPSDFTLEGEAGESYPAVTGFDVANAINEDVTIAPGDSVSGVLFFDIPDDIKVTNLVDNSVLNGLKVNLPPPVQQQP